VARDVPAPTVRALLLMMAPLLLGATDFRGNFDNRLVAAHNRERAALGIPSLEWDEQLAAGARDWADHLAATELFEHSPNEPGQQPIGENIWGGTPGRFSPERMVGLWVSEKNNFKEGVFPANSTTGRVDDVSHYTQVVWRESRRVGCAVSRGAREEILVCRYSRAGNVIGRVPF
jgi:hypothetical protein